MSFTITEQDEGYIDSLIVETNVLSEWNYEEAIGESVEYEDGKATLVDAAKRITAYMQARKTGKTELEAYWHAKSINIPASSRAT